MAEPNAIVAVTVQVPTDRVRDFEVILGALMSAAPVPEPAPGSPATSWTPITVPLTPVKVPKFYEAFGRWLSQATAALPVPPEMSEAQLTELWESLPSVERELLALLSDDYGRAIGWPELKAKLRLAGKPSLARNFPTLVARCSELPCRCPVDQTGDGDDTVFTLRRDLIDPVAALGKEP